MASRLSATIRAARGAVQQSRVHVGSKHAGCDRVYVDPRLGPFHRQAARQGENAGLGCGVRRHARATRGGVLERRTVDVGHLAQHRRRTVGERVEVVPTLEHHQSPTGRHQTQHATRERRIVARSQTEVGDGIIAVRVETRRRIAANKRNRRVPVGPHVTFYFENWETMWLQVHEMVFIEKNKTLRQALSLALRSGYSRIPVIGEDLDDIVGIAYIKDLAKRSHDFREAEQNETVAELMRPANFVPENKMADELLTEMQSQQIHLAIVVDEYGGTAGLITIEDILEEIVGEISDEFDDDDDEQLEQLSERKYRAKARIHLEDLERELGLEFAEEDNEAVDTLGGLLGKHIGQVPIPGSEITIGSWRFIAERPVGRRKRVGTVLIENEGMSDESDK